jgi:hypothetical protein
LSVIPVSFRYRLPAHPRGSIFRIVLPILRADEMIE